MAGAKVLVGWQVPPADLGGQEVQGDGVDQGLGWADALLGLIGTDDRVQHPAVRRGDADVATDDTLGGLEENLGSSVVRFADRHGRGFLMGMRKVRIYERL
jgi:hypothetical protein